MKESQRIEWKESWRDEFLKTICGFANADGGVLTVGRNDQGEVVGVANAAKLLEDLPNKIRDLLGIMVDVNLRKKSSREYLEIAVEACPNPISYRGEYYVRSGSTTQSLKGAALDKFLLRKQGRHWDAVPVPHVAVKDLDRKALAFFRRQAARSKRVAPEVLQERDPALIEKLHLIEGKYLKRAAVLLFHPDPERFVSGAFVKIGLFENDADLRHQDEIHGDLFSQVNQTIEVLRLKYLKAWITYEGLQRIETYPVPEPALREAVLNAIVHKDYAAAIPVQISVYPDKLMIWNPGQLPPDWTVKKLLSKHASQPFNPDVARAFFRAGQIEAWGRGFERILAECRAAGAPVPEVRYETSGLWMVFPFAGDQVLAKVTTQENTQENTQAQIVAILAARPTATRRELARALGRTEDSVRHYLRVLTAAGRIRHVGPTKAGRWEVLQ